MELFFNSKYKNKLNSDSKILYGFLLNRLSLSSKNHWCDENGIGDKVHKISSPFSFI